MTSRRFMRIRFLTEMQIRKAKPNDLPALLRVYAVARAYMTKMGNPTQWQGGYPREELLVADIARGELYVLAEKETIHGAFLLAVGEDPTYAYIEDGAWANDLPYGTLHRVASDGVLRGVFHAAVAYAENIIPNLRVDTHADNKPMQTAILREGFVYCGRIYVEDGSPRLAYQRPAK